LYSVLYRHHIFFIHLSVEHFVFFHSLAIMNSAVIDTGEQMSLQLLLSFSLNIYPVMGLLDHMAVLFFNSEQPLYYLLQ
jgi:hypothetical protein